MKLTFVDLSLDEDEQSSALAAVARVMESGRFVLGPEVEAFEAEALAASLGVNHAVGVASGTDALIAGLRGLGIGHGDEVILPAFTAFPTVAAVLETGATPVLVDVDADRPLLDLDATIDAVTVRTRAVVLVHMYGCVADARGFLDALRGTHEIALVEDCAQAQGALLPSGEPTGSVGRFGAFSFYPTKVLGGLGDGGALATGDAALAEEVRSWRNHGERNARLVHHLPARNSRLDEIQAAVLRLRLASLPARLEALRLLSGRYEITLSPEVRYVSHGQLGAPHLAVVRTESPNADALAALLRDDGIPTGRHYPLALVDQPVLACLATTPVPNARAWAETCLSLPLHHRMTSSDVERVSEAVLAYVDHERTRRALS